MTLDRTVELIQKLGFPITALIGIAWGTVAATKAVYNDIILPGTAAYLDFMASGKEHMLKADEHAEARQRTFDTLAGTVQEQHKIQRQIAKALKIEAEREAETKAESEGEN